MRLKTHLIKSFDFGLLLNILIICIIGILGISSTTHAFTDGTKHYFIMQILWTIAGVGLLVMTAAFDYRNIKDYYKLIYVANIILLGAVVVLGKITNGANRSLGIGSFGIQPSEFIKITLTILFAKKIEDFDGNLNNFKNLGILFLYAIIPMGLIAIQPDLGTNIVILTVIIGMLFMGGLDIKILATGALTAVLTALTAWFSPLKILKPYQKDRIMVFLNPESDRLGKGYHVVHSKISIGSGKLLGMGFNKGIYSQGKFLPESHTDFIFSVIGEEFGFMGAMALISLYIHMIFKCLKIAKTSKDKFGSMVVFGMIFMFTIQMFQNIGMTIGLMPVTGIPLPFVSYGGSSMLTSMMGMGLVLNVGMRRRKIVF